MSIFLWILQIVLALMFLGIGTQRLTRPALNVAAPILARKRYLQQEARRLRRETDK